MPVIYDKEMGKQWLDGPLSASSKFLAAVLQPLPSELMKAHDVSTLVNSLRMIWRRALNLFRPTNPLSRSSCSFSERVHPQHSGLRNADVRSSVRNGLMDASTQIRLAGNFQKRKTAVACLAWLFTSDRRIQMLRQPTSPNMDGITAWCARRESNSELNC